MHPSPHHMGMSNLSMSYQPHPPNDFDMQQSLAARANSSRNNQNTFVHKLGMLISDPKHSDLIFWNSDGKSFTVKNIDEFSKTVLPLHFKHNNFASFIRQLNMYGFHKINRSPRGHRADPSYQTWEFSHPKFLRDNLDLIREIRRTATEPDLNIKPNNPGNDPGMQLAIFQSQQAELISRVDSLTNDLAQVKRELAESNRVLAVQQQVIRKLTSINRQNMGTSNSPLLSDNGTGHSEKVLFPNDSGQPTIFVTPPETQNLQNNYQKGGPRMHDSNSFLIPSNNESQPGLMNNSYTNMGNNPQNSYSHQAAPHSGTRPMLSINTMNFHGQGHLTPNHMGGHGSEMSDDDFSRVSPRSPISPFQLQQPSGYHQLNASPVDPNSNILFKNPPS